MYMEILRALVAGMIVGAVFNFVKLPIPAPNAVAGIVGIIGIYIGFVVVSNLK
jgi:XapX domain-containing protein